jgi:hypothetical protein
VPSPFLLAPAGTFPPPQDSKVLSTQLFGKDVGEDKAEGLMEASAMAAASRDIMVTFRWLDSEKTDGLDSRGNSAVHDH